MTEHETADALAALLRWEASGAVWTVRSTADDLAIVDLLTCDGGETVGRLRSSDPAFVDHVRAHADRH